MKKRKAIMATWYNDGAYQDKVGHGRIAYPDGDLTGCFTREELRESVGPGVPCFAIKDVPFHAIMNQPENKALLPAFYAQNGGVSF